MMEPPAEPVRPGEPRPEATRLPALSRFWWLTAVRGLVALTLALAIVSPGVAPTAWRPSVASTGWPAG
ncbi:MAG TPA: hypothetical protein VH016_00975 [Actinomycetota bacterium]|nr:hypothetical protein [Actinomycetota bacterium]